MHLLENIFLLYWEPKRQIFFNWYLKRCYANSTRNKIQQQIILFYSEIVKTDKYCTHLQDISGRVPKRQDSLLRLPNLKTATSEGKIDDVTVNNRGVRHCC